VSLNPADNWLNSLLNSSFCYCLRFDINDIYLRIRQPIPMNSKEKIQSYLNSFDPKSDHYYDLLNDYFEKCSENLKYAHKRSQRIGQFILLTIAFNLLPLEDIKAEVAGLKVSFQVIQDVTPAAITYLLFEWLVLSYRRRDIMFAMQFIAKKIYKVPAVNDFPKFEPNSQNIIPLSLLTEAYNMRHSQLNKDLYRWAAFPVGGFLLLFVAAAEVSTSRHLLHLCGTFHSMSFFNFISFLFSIIYLIIIESLFIIFLVWICYICVLEIQDPWVEDGWLKHRLHRFQRLLKRKRRHKK